MFRKYLNHRWQVFHLDYWKKHWAAYFLVFFFPFIGTLALWTHYDMEKRKALLLAQREADAEYVAAEVERRKVERQLDRPEAMTPRETEILIAGTPKEKITSPPTVEMVENVELITSGPHKGMTKKASYALSRQELAESKAAATRWHKWEQKSIALSKRMVELSRKKDPLTEASLTNGDAYLKHMLDYYAQLSDEQIEHTWERALALRPEDKAKVDRFFTDLVNHKRGGTSKSPEQIAEDAKDILRTREAMRVARAEWKVEWQLLLQEMSGHRARKPPRPKNLIRR